MGCLHCSLSKNLLRSFWMESSLSAGVGLLQVLWYPPTGFSGALEHCLNLKTDCRVLLNPDQVWKICWSHYFSLFLFHQRTKPPWSPRKWSHQISTGSPVVHLPCVSGLSSPHLLEEGFFLPPCQEAHNQSGSMSSPFFTVLVKRLLCAFLPNKTFWTPVFSGILKCIIMWIRHLKYITKCYTFLFWKSSRSFDFETQTCFSSVLHGCWCVR